jgi:hypothetical protein
MLVYLCVDLAFAVSNCRILPCLIHKILFSFKDHLNSNTVSGRGNSSGTKNPWKVTKRYKPIDNFYKMNDV